MKRFDHLRNVYPLEIGTVKSVAWHLPWPIRVDWPNGKWDYFDADELEVVE